MSAPCRILTLRLKTGWWNQIRDGSKLHELRLATPRYRRQLLGREYDEIHLWLGYPPRDDHSKLMKFAWRGASLVTMQHPHFGASPVELISIDLSAPLSKPSDPQGAVLL